MKPFNLQTVLDYRKRLEDIAKSRLIDARKIFHTVQEKYTSQKNILDQTLMTFDKLQREGIDIVELIRYEDHLEQLRENLKAIEKTLQEKQHTVAIEQENLTRRAKERQIMEKLKVNQNNAWQAYLNKKEAAMLDEIAIIRHDRQESQQEKENS